MTEIIDLGEASGWAPTLEALYEQLHKRMKAKVPTATVTVSFHRWEILAQWGLRSPHVAKVGYGTLKVLSAAGEIDVLYSDALEGDKAEFA